MENDGFKTMASLVGKLLPYAADVAVVPGSAGFGIAIEEVGKLEPEPLAMWSARDVLCDTNVREGYLDNSITCRNIRSGEVLLKAKLSDGNLDGKLVAYRYRGGEQSPGAVAVFKNNQLDGTFELYSARTNKLVREISYTKGSPDGDEKAFYYDTGNLRLVGHSTDGLADGELVEYAPDRKVIHRVHYERGLPTGTEETFDAQTGKLLGRANYLKGKLNGLSQLWDTSGKLVGVGEWENGVAVLDPAVVACQAPHVRPLGGTSAAENIRFNEVLYAECWEKIHPGSGATKQSSARNDAASSDLEISEAIQKAAKGTETATGASEQPSPAMNVGSSDHEIVEAIQKAADHIETRCGWIENDMPSSLTVQDRDGTWSLAEIDRQADGLDTAPGLSFPKGTSCGCVTGDTQPAQHVFTKVTRASIKPAKACQADKSLK